MATQVFLHDTAATTHRGTNTAGLNGTASGWLPKATSTSRGSGVVSKITNTVAGPTNGIEVTNGAAATRLEWLTPPVDQDVTISGTITANIWALESGNTVNATIQVRVEKMAAATGTLTQIAKSAFATELTTGNLARNFTVTPTSTALNKGDYLRITVFADDASSNMTVGTVTTAYAGTTAAASGDTYVTFTETFGFQTEGSAPIVSQLGAGSGAGGGGEIYGSGGGDEAYAQGFTLASGYVVTGASAYLDKIGSPTDNIVVAVVSTLGGSALASVTTAASGVSATAGFVSFTFTTPVSLAAGSYYLQITRSGARSTANYIQWYYETTNPYAGGEPSRSVSGAWVSPGAGWDRAFTVVGYADLFTGSTLYPTDTASDVATDDVDREAWTSRGAGVQTDVTSTTTGWTTPIQVTDSVVATATSYTPTDDGSANVGFDTSAVRLAQGFLIGAPADITRVDLKLFKTGSPADNFTVSIRTQSSSFPSSTTLSTSAPIAASTLGASPGAVVTVPITPVSLTDSTPYWIVVERSGSTDSSNYISWRNKSASTYTSGLPAVQNSGGTWSSLGANDFYFLLRTGAQPVTWYTKPLEAFTLSGLVKVNRRVLASNAAANASIGAEIARVDEDGTNATVWGYANRDAAVTSGGAGEVATTETAYTVYVSGDDLAFTDGQRIRIRLYQDDCADVPTVTGHSLTSYYGGTSGGASGDTYLILGQTLTEFSAGTTVSVTPGAVTFAGQTVLLTNTVAVTPGAVTLAGQTVNTSVATVVGVTPGAVTLAGQTVALKNTVAVTPGAITLTGQTVNIAVPTVVGVTPGALTLTGQTVLLRQSQAVGAGALTLTGQTVLLRTNMAVTPGAVTVTGQTVNTLIAVVVGVTAGALTVTGQTVNTLLVTVVAVTPGAITLTGQTVNLGGATSVAVTPGAVTITGQTILLTQSQAVGAGVLSISGQTVLLRTNMVVTAGAVTLTGQTVNLGGVITVAVTPGAITLTGQTVNVGGTVPVTVTPGALTVSGQTVLLRQSQSVGTGALTITGQAVGLTGAINVTATPGAVTLTGQTVLLRTNLVVTPGAVTLTGQTVNTGGVVSVPVTTPGAVTFAGQTVNLLQFQAITAGAVTIAGQSALLRTNLAVTPGAVTFTGQTVNTLLVTVVPVTPAAVAVAGQTVLLRSSQTVTAGAVAFAGQAVGLTGAVNVTTTPAAVILTGQAVNLKNTVVVTPGAVTLQGQTVNTGTVTTVPVTPGAITLAGQPVLLRNTVSVAPGALSLAGQTIGTIRTIPVTPGALTLAGQQVALRTLAALQPGTITITGSDVHLGIPEEYIVALQARWKPTLVLEGRHAPTVANRGAHRPTLVREGAWVPMLTKAGAASP